MANRLPRKPVRQGGNGRRKPSAAVPPVQPPNFAAGVGSRFSEAITREPDLGGGLPRAPYPIIASNPVEIHRRALQKEEANRRRSTANNVSGYVAPASPRLAGLPTAAELLAATADVDDTRIPTAEELLAGSTWQPPRDQAEGTYVFPQVSPTKTINPMRPRTLEAGYDRETRTLRVRFRDGTAWEYFEVSPEEWQQFKRVRSPGRFINRRLNAHPYQRGNF